MDYIRSASGLVAMTLGLCLGVATANAQDNMGVELLPDDIRDAGVLNVGSQQTFPPVEYKEPGASEVVGVSADLLAEISSRLGLELNYIHGEYASLIPGLESQRFDVASGGISDTLEREQTVDFVNYMMSGGSILVRAEDAESYQTIADFCGGTVAMLLGSNTIMAALETANQECEAAGEEPFTIDQLPSAPDARAQLDLGRVDGYLGDFPALVYFISNAPGDYAIAGGNYILTPYVTSWAFSKEDTALRDAVQATAQAMLEDGTYRDLLAKWGLEGGALPEITVNLPASERN
ncbi:ABC transporter substrate-binding protein [Pelagibacterium halotolerans]|uniref:ABC transporter substrate-binding protein n=1 Tax=Pelagibacterium halotolerans (strain DSM 22347 / JCM 15775 / CGMCC 1.7692 / B2) TaxID=1082931 RepID=G4R8C6_PELHB|nr:ABC transporter substrate-binding protein [Pelagibacterium halotolerans]AEQ52370.1 ABC transporter substrate-binding protein [Pelagibacterium halotolerans B2]QJR17891.1 ABC transporter substrate-binding protein [Pelagibacterium halotolerans]SEA34556.1 amino acid ABC transporter substrate-binding protein, PAAT family [Pelagibacterium halotolerans]